MRMSFFAELQRRNVLRVAAAYVVFAWLIIQVAETIFPLYGFSDAATRLVITLLAVGTLPVLVLAWVFEITADGLMLEKNVDRSQSITPQTGRRLDRIITVVLALALGYFALDKFVLDPARDAKREASVARQARTEALTQSYGDQSIAVLPFLDMSPEGDQEYFSDGISEELLNLLAKIRELRVISRSSAFSYKGKDVKLPDMARELNVAHILEGSVRKSGNKVRITVQLIEARSDTHLWSDTYDRTLDDIFAIQDEIAVAVVDQLKIQLALDGGNGRTSLVVRKAANVAAFEAYMQGRQLINLRGQPNLEEAVTHLGRALALDETYAPAHAQLATAILLLSNSSGSYGDFTLEEVRRRATPHIERALELDERLPDAFAARTLLGLLALDFADVVTNGNRALELNPSHANVINWLFIGHIGLGQYVEAYETLDRLLEVDPLSIAGRYNRAHKLQFLTGQVGAARALANSIFRQNPAFSYFTHAAISFWAGNPAETLEWSLKVYDLDPQGPTNNVDMGRALGQLNLLPEALRLGNDLHYWAYLNLRMWPESITAARQRLEKDQSDPNSILYLANALHLSGDIEQAQVLYEELLALHPDLPIIDTSSETNAATVRAALGRLRSGDEAGALKLIELTTEDLRQRNHAEFVHGEYYRSAAIVAALEGDNDAALDNIEKAIEKGSRDPTLFSEPTFDALRDWPEFQALESRLDSILAAQRVKALQMICFNNPVANTWQPLAATCEGVATGGRD